MHTSCGNFLARIQRVSQKATLTTIFVLGLGAPSRIQMHAPNFIHFQQKLPFSKQNGPPDVIHKGLLLLRNAKRDSICVQAPFKIDLRRLRDFSSANVAKHVLNETDTGLIHSLMAGRGELGFPPKVRASAQGKKKLFRPRGEAPRAEKFFLSEGWCTDRGRKSQFSPTSHSGKTFLYMFYLCKSRVQL